MRGQALVDVGELLQADVRGTKQHRAHVGQMRGFLCVLADDAFEEEGLQHSMQGYRKEPLFNWAQSTN
jgi:hypothetical protein